MTNCEICNNQQLANKIDSMVKAGKGTRQIANSLDLTRYAVRKHLGHGKQQKKVQAPSGWNGGVDVTSDGGTICSGPVSKPVTDWSKLLELWGLDTDEFEVVEPVTFKAWDTYSGKMYSYKATIRRMLITSIDTAKWFDIISYVDEKPRFSLGDYAYVICIADPQLGKPGTQEAVRMWREGVQKHVNKINNLYTKPSRIVVAFMGDEIESISNHYDNQSHIVELNLSQQIQLDFDMRMWTLNMVRALGLPITVTSVASNHGEISRRAGDRSNVTSIYDNESTMVANLVKSAYINAGVRFDWHIAENSPDVVIELSGVKVLFTHGHIQKGRGTSSEAKMKDALERQIIGRTSELGDVKLFVLGHFHHVWMNQEQDRMYIGCPALEAEKSSQYFVDERGVWSRPGILGFTVSRNNRCVINDINIY